MNRRTGVGAAAPGRAKQRLRSTVPAIALLLASAAAAPMAQAQSYQFSSVAVEGNARVSDGTILSYADIARGQTVSAAELNAAYQRILASGLFETVTIEPRGGRLVIEVTEYPTVNRISFEGNRRLDDEVLAGVIRSQSRRVFNPATAEADAANIAQAYQQSGRIAARVTPKVIERSENRVDLVFEIFEGGLVEIERIGFVGNEAFSDRRLRGVLETKQAGLLRLLIKSDTFVEERIELDKQLLRDFYASRGYVDFRITGVNAELTRERDAYFITFNVQEGSQFTIGNVGVSSEIAGLDTSAYQAAVKLRPGTVYNPARIEADIARLEALAVRQGQNFIRVEPVITRNDRDVSLNVNYKLSRGPRIFVERIDIEGNTTTMDRVIRRQFKVAEGDPFNPREIRAAAERIRALGYFTTAEVNARQGSREDQVIVDVDVEEQPTGSLTVGGSYSTANGFGAVIRFRESNFLGRGQTLSLGVSTGTDNRVYSLGFTEPAFLGRDLRFDLGASFIETDYAGAEYDTAIARFQPAFSFPVSPNGRLELRYTAEGDEITGLGDDIGALITAEAARGRVWESSLGYTYSWDTRREDLDPVTDMLLEFGQDFGGVGGDNTFIKTSARAVAQTRVWNDEVTLRATFEGGALSYSSGGGRVTDRFFMGPSVMRGFEPRGIGPRERDGADVNDALGGNFYAVARFDAEFPLGLPEEYGITGGVFYDVGSLWGLDSTNPDVIYEDFSLRHVVGLSLFWDTPVGPLRFNFSEALVKEKHDEEQNFNLTISTDF